MKNLNDFLNEKKSKELIVTGSTPSDHDKIKKWLKTSDFTADEKSDYFTFVEDNLDALEKELDKIFIKKDISVSFESQ